MELERLETEWYADGLEAVLHLHMRFEGETPPFLVEVARPCCERFTHAPQWPDPGAALTCVVPRESFEGAETIRLIIKASGRPERQTVFWESEARAVEIDGEPRIEILQGPDLMERRAA
jgi:hypothetical protein